MSLSTSLLYPCLRVCESASHQKNVKQACMAFSVSFRNSRHTLTAAKYQNEESVDKLFLQTSVFFLLP